jgi:succinyl-diaminopimelate desuccinylase
MEKVIAYINTLEELAIELETELCKYPAISPENAGQGEIDKCLFLEGWLRRQGITNLERFDAPDSRAKAGIRPNLVATIEGANPGKGAFWIMSHMDVVPPGEMSLWKSDPWKAVVSAEGSTKRITGRGVEDNQQGLVASVLAALALLRQGIRPERTVKLLFVSDEENGSEYGIGWMMKNHPALFRPGDHGRRAKFGLRA